MSVIGWNQIPLKENRNIRLCARLITELHLAVGTRLLRRVTPRPLSNAFCFNTRLSDRLLDGILQGRGREGAMRRVRDPPFLGCERPLGQLSVCLNALVDGHLQPSEHDSDDSVGFV